MFTFIVADATADATDATVGDFTSNAISSDNDKRGNNGRTGNNGKARVGGDVGGDTTVDILCKTLSQEYRQHDLTIQECSLT